MVHCEQTGVGWISFCYYGKIGGSEVLETDGKRSVVFWFTGTDEVEAEKTWKQLINSSMQEMKMNKVHEVMLDILKPLDRCGGVGFEISADGEEKGMCFPCMISYCCDIR